MVNGYKNSHVNSVVVTDNAPYHNIQSNPASNTNSRKSDMLRWLHEKSMLKPEIYELIILNENHHNRFHEVLLEHGHNVLRLLPYHPDLNPIELIRVTVKNNVSQKNVIFKLKNVRKLAEHEFDQITSEEWRHVVDIHVVADMFFNKCGSSQSKQIS
nr:uncharacterized protein LOC111511303 [Leptinotarsa decemlineata]